MHQIPVVMPGHEADPILPPVVTEAPKFEGEFATIEGEQWRRATDAEVEHYERFWTEFHVQFEDNGLGEDEAYEAAVRVLRERAGLPEGEALSEFHPEHIA